MSIEQREAIGIDNFVKVESNIVTSTSFSKSLCGRFFETFNENSYIPAKSILEFNDASGVGELFGINSYEYKLASEYFGFTNKSGDSPSLISFAGFNTSTTNPFIRTKRINIQNICDTLKLISDGSFNLKVNNIPNVITGLDFTYETQITGYLTVIQDALDNVFGTGDLNGYTIEYVSNLECLVLKKNNAIVSNAINLEMVSATTGTDISTILGLNSSGDILNNNGSAYTSILECLEENTQGKNNNFGSFGFINKSLSNNDLENIHSFLNSVDNKYLFCCNVNNSNYNDIYELTKNYENFSLNYDTQTDSNSIPAFFIPMTIMASIDWDGTDSSQNFSFQNFSNLNIESCNNTLYKELTSKYININCEIQHAGNSVFRYTKGYCSNGVETNIIANKIWLDNEIQGELFNLLDNSNIISDTKLDQTKCDDVVRDCISKGCNNGAIKFGIASLTEAQKIKIRNFFGHDIDDTIFNKIIQEGYYLESDFKDNNENKKYYEVKLVYLAVNIIQLFIVKQNILK